MICYVTLNVCFFPQRLVLYISCVTNLHLKRNIVIDPQKIIVEHTHDNSGSLTLRTEYAH